MSDYEYEIVRTLRVIDGDTVDLEVRRTFDAGFGNHLTYQGRYRARLVVVDTPEKGTEQYLKAAQFTFHWLNDVGPKRLLARTYKPRGTVADGGFGRWLTDIYDANSGTTLSSELLRLGYMEYRRAR